MNFARIAWRNMQQRGLASLLTCLSMALGVAAVVCVIVIHRLAVEQFEQDAQGYHFIVGGNGGALQLVLSTVYHLDKPLPPVSYDYYREFVTGKYKDFTERAVPYCLGDSYEAAGKLFRVVATSPEMFQLRYDGEQTYQFREGRCFEPTGFFEAVVGSVVASQGKLKVGDRFNPTHGLGAEGEKHQEFTVVGVLAPTGTANDRAVFANLEGFYLLEGHSLKPREDNESAPVYTISPSEGRDGEGRLVAALPEPQREVTAILVEAKDPTMSLAMSQSILKGEDRSIQAVAPTAIIARLLDGIIGPLRVILLVLTTLIVVVAAIGMLVSIYNSMADRAHDIAVMRALGASRVAVLVIVLLESVLLSVLGGLAGVVLGHAMIALAGPLVESRTGIVLHPLAFDPQELRLIAGLVLLATTVGLLPAFTAYRTDVGKALAGSR